MKVTRSTALLLAADVAFGSTKCNPTVSDPLRQITYTGQHRNGIEVFLGIPFGEDTGGENRFKPPRPVNPTAGSNIDARSYGPACTQQLGRSYAPGSLTPITNTSEDCLNLNVARPNGTLPTANLPVMVWIYGGSFWTGQNREVTTSPDGLILESVANGLPVIHVAMNYRLGFFGFAKSDALTAEGSANAGVKDQRLALEWVRDNIAAFGGNPNKVTIFGQSSGGLAVSMQILAYGGTKPAPFQQGICESQALAPGITGSLTDNNMQLMVDAVGCNTTALHAPETIACLRAKDVTTLTDAMVATWDGADSWLPTVDGDFLPDAPSKLITEGRFADVSAVMMGWTEDDMTLYSPGSLKTPEQTEAFVAGSFPDLSANQVSQLLALYPSSDFPANKSGHSPEYYRFPRILRDIGMVCQPIWLAQNIVAAKGSKAYLYDWNQTIAGPVFENVRNLSGIGVPHTSEFGYIFGNISMYDVNGYPYNPTESDWQLQHRGSRSWSTFASTGQPSMEGKNMFQGWEDAFTAGVDNAKIFVAGGPNEGLSTMDGPGSLPELEAQKLRERCSFINSPEIIEAMKF